MLERNLKEHSGRYILLKELKMYFQLLFTSLINLNSIYSEYLLADFIYPIYGYLHDPCTNKLIMEFLANYVLRFETLLGTLKYTLPKINFKLIRTWGHANEYSLVKWCNYTNIATNFIIN